MATRIRNDECVPYICTEGTFIKPLTFVRHGKVAWCKELPSFQRMHAHHTLASARRYAFFKNFPGLVPADELDFVLSASYNQSDEIFPDKVDIYLQRETLGEDTWRRLRNTRDLIPHLESQLVGKDDSSHINRQKRRKTGVIPYKYNFAHPVLIGGIIEKKHPSNVKLMNSSHHSPQTNAGYSRQDPLGNLYQY